MSAMTGTIESHRFASDVLRPPDRVPRYRELACRMLGTLDIQPVGAKFTCDARFFRLPGLGISRIAGSAIRGTRTREMAAGDEELLLIANLGGAATVTHLGREARLPAGSAVLVSSTDPCRVERTESCHLYIRMPRAVLVPLIAKPADALMSVIPPNTEPLRVLAGYADLLLQDSQPMQGAAELRRLAVNHVHDLVALTIGATRDAAEIAAGRGLRAARRSAIKTDIAQNLAGDVTAAALSARHRLSERYIRKLFESESTSLSRFVLMQRLTRVHRILRDPQHAHRRIAEIAFAVGFGDISTFNREFRRQFSMTPSDVRRYLSIPAPMKAAT
jgi:AraC-like DNA-binding protein